MQSNTTSTRPDEMHPDAGWTMVATALSMGITAILVALLVATAFKSSTTSNTSISNAPGVAQATALQAQETLSTALTSVDAAAAGGGYGSLNVSTLSASDPSISFVSGPSTGPTTVSVAVAAGPGGDVGGIGGVGGVGDAGGGSGSVTLADRSTSGTCWLVWKSAGVAWYGAQTNLSSCTAPSLASTPSPGPVSSTTIGWQQGTFPAP
jgi:hypothetical protein